MWKQPWGYKEGYVICGGLFLTGLSLQAAVGGFHLETLAYPINLLAAVFFVLLFCPDWLNLKVRLKKNPAQFIRDNAP